MISPASDSATQMRVLPKVGICENAAAVLSKVRKLAVPFHAREIFRLGRANADIRAIRHQVMAFDSRLVHCSDNIFSSSSISAS